jgi:hypothetical protein
VESEKNRKARKFTEHWRIRAMKKIAVFAIAVLIVTLESGLAFAQSSGSFNAAGTSAACAIGTGGTFNGGVGTLNVLETGVQTSNGYGTTLVIRPSLVTGLFTQTKISSTTVSTASADVGIQVCVTIDGQRKGIYPAGGCVVYDERFQQISSQLFSQLTECTTFNTGQTCTTNADCTALGTGYSCSIPAGAATGTCVGPNPNCNFDLILSTLSAHNYDFVAQVPGGYHTVRASWSTIGQGAGSGSSIASCVGPGVVTVTQTKVFQQNGSLSY